MTHKVLLVDDVSMFIELQKDYLQLSAVNILTARDGKEALKVCRNERPDLVFMDLHMPVMSGAECCLAIKEDKQLSSTGVILITSEGKEADRTACIGAGCDKFLTKPLDRHIFLETARSLLPSIDRRDRRIMCHIKAKFRAYGVSLSGTIVNMSQNGVYLAADCEITMGTVLDLVFALSEPFGTVIQLKGRVAWLNTKKARIKQSLPEGFGVEFVSPSQEVTGALASYVASEFT